MKTFEELKRELEDKSTVIAEVTNKELSLAWEPLDEANGPIEGTGWSRIGQASHKSGKRVLFVCYTGLLN